MPPPGVLNESQTQQLTDLVNEFEDVFMGPDGQVGFTDRVLHRIETEGTHTRHT